MSEPVDISSLPLNQRVAKLHDVTTKNYRYRFTQNTMDTIKATLNEIGSPVDINNENWKASVSNALGEYMKANNIQEESFF